ncbi:unnamed protein product [Staurois parvus]|uniref:Uncharacterized protein n=1 Tax=Staurois parvus TaxID=386267 RepID=A0ABN9CU22_9NEOB|nr:unnamed protein product [Staurois parvus]
MQAPHSFLSLNHFYLHLVFYKLFKPSAKPEANKTCACNQGWTDNSWGPRAIGDHGAPVSLPKLKKAYEKGTRGISWGPLLTLGPRAVPEFPNGQSAPALGISP